MNVQAGIRECAAWALGPVARKVTARHARIFMYHRFGDRTSADCTDAAAFEAHARYIKRNFRACHLRDVVARLKAREPLESRTVVITVDDGYRDFAEFAYPILQKYEIPATLYLVSDFVNERRWLWFDALDYLVRSAPAGSYSLRLGEHSIAITLDSDDRRYTLWTQLTDYCARLSPTARDHALLKVQHDLGVALPAKTTARYAPLTWDELSKLDSGLIDVGAHTRSHPILSKCSIEEQRAEIEGSKKTIEEALGRPVDAFCYPNGMPQDFTNETERLVREAGFSSAVMACGGGVKAASDPYRLERVGAPTQWRWFRNCINGLWQVRHALLHGQWLAYVAVGW